MKAESLLASAGINIGLALVIFTLFSVLKKQPFTAPIYFSRRIAAGEELPIDRHFSLRRLCPSVSWIPLAFRLSEEDVIRQRGLDALVVLRLFKLGQDSSFPRFAHLRTELQARAVFFPIPLPYLINFFTVCCLLGLLILVPVNYASQQYSTSNVISYSMDSFTISNVPKGSNRLWVHFSCLCFVTFYALSMLYKEYKVVLNKRIQCIGIQRHRPDYFTILVRGIPLCEEHNAHGCSVDHFFSKHYPSTYQAFEMIYEGKAVEELQASSTSFWSAKLK
ncbi:hypothetical protein IEQ34_016675 [Dendrobium chrysotoxum]|uniref:CSC1/OSCA1-like N-terminal transmembrane domain-containing protein n=1 Tax=Dendrobium chrysotoxum TaxID=161865 RepID=A0AAV7GE65_DENCH|nr:hypothetical protein IEQ34_016675 [Dendrobium chrysotoxum]